MREAFIGTWELLSFEMRMENGEIAHPFGRKVVGLLIYTPDGRVAVQMMSVGRGRFQSNDPLGGTLEEVRAAFSTYGAYFGSYEIDAANRLVHHDVDGSLQPNQQGQRQTRTYVMDGGQLTLSTRSMSVGNQTGQLVLLWRKVGG